MRNVSHPIDADRILVLITAGFFAILIAATPGYPDDGIRRDIKTLILADRANDYPLDLADPAASQATRDKIREQVRGRTTEYLKNFVNGFDPDEIKKSLAKTAETTNQLPGDVMAFIGSLDTTELDDGFEKDTREVDQAKKLFVFKALLEFDATDAPGNAAVKSTRIGEEEKGLPGSGAEVERMNALRAYEKSHERKYRFEIDQAKVIKEDPSDYVENMKYLKEIAAKGGLPNSITSQAWINGQADCVDDNGNAKPGVWIHTHADGTIRDFPQDSYETPPLKSGKELAATELDALDKKTPMNQYRDLVSNAEQKVLYVDYEHHETGSTPTPDTIDVNKVGAPGTQIVTDSDHPYGNTKDGTGNWDKKIIRAVYWRDISIPILMINEKGGDRCFVSDVILLWEKMVDLYDVPPAKLVYMIPPLLEPPDPGPTYTRNQFPLKPSYGGR